VGGVAAGTFDYDEETGAVELEWLRPPAEGVRERAAARAGEIRRLLSELHGTPVQWRTDRAEPTPFLS
jgi:hypothetical protein